MKKGLALVGYFRELSYNYMVITEECNLFHIITAKKLEEIFIQIVNKYLNDEPWLRITTCPNCGTIWLDYHSFVHASIC